MTRATFTRMRDGTAADYAVIDAAEAEYDKELPARVMTAVEALGNAGLGGFPVTRLEHSRQSASRAVRDDRPTEYIVACLVHDIGDGLAPHAHGSFAASVLRPYVSEQITWIVEHHPVFQMYYYAHHTGGDRNARERYRGHEWFDATVEFCERYDENCFDPNYDSLPLDYFKPLVEDVFSRPPFTSLG